MSDWCVCEKDWKDRGLTDPSCWPCQAQAEGWSPPEETESLRAQLAEHEKPDPVWDAMEKLQDLFEAHSHEEVVELVVAMRGQLAEARVLRLGRGPTVEEAETHLHDSGGRCLVATVGDGDNWCATHMKTNDDVGILLMVISDFIPLDANGQPCPIGGWR